MPKLLQAVTTQTVEDYAGRRSAKGDAPATINRDLRHLRTLVNWAKRREYIREVPNFRRAFVREDEPAPVVIPREHFDAIVAAVDKAKRTVVKSPLWWRTFLHVAYGLGCRRGEILGLRWKHVDLDGKELTVRRETSKGRKDRTLPLVGEVLAFLQQWRHESKPAGNGLVLEWPGSMSSLHANWRRILKAANLPEGVSYVPKNCRSTCGSQMVQNGVPTMVVRDFLGHSTVVTTERFYVTTDKDSLRKAAESREKKGKSLDAG